MVASLGLLERLKRSWAPPPPPPPYGRGQGDGAPYAPPGANTELGRLLWTDPVPLIHSDARMIVIFSPKSACTSVVVWFLHQLGHAKAAFEYHSWPHRYRINVYYRSQLYQRAYDLDLSKFAVVRVVRDPFDRAASSFRHAVKNAYADEEISASLKRSEIATAGLSFAEFLDFLDQSDLRTANPHHRIQHHPLEDKLPVTHLINISTQDLHTSLNEVEADLGLPRTDFAALPWMQRVTNRRNRLHVSETANDAYATRFGREVARRGPWPPSSALLTATARERIARLYAVDIESYVKPAETSRG